MLDTGENAAPVATVEGLVNDPTRFNINSLSFDDFVIYSSEQFQNQGLVADIRVRSVPPTKYSLVRRETAIVISPCFGLVLNHLPMSFVTHE